MNSRHLDRKALPVLTLFGILYTMTTVYAFGQRNSLETSVDPRITAMGESFVAVPAYVGAMTSNPAGLAGIKGVSLSYGQINENEGNIRGSGYISFKGTVHIPFVDIGLLYTRHNHGEVPFTTEQYPNGFGQEYNPYEYTLGIGIARRFGSFSVGAAAKRFDRRRVYNPSSMYTTTVTKPLLFDLGVQYTHGFSSNEDAPNQRMSIGVCYQNVGDDIKTETVFSQQPSIRYLTTTKIPRYLRIGLAYQFQTRAEIDDRLMPFHLLITSEYRYETSPYQHSRNNLLSFGLEGIVYDVFSYRIGGYGYREETYVRFGAGLCAPLRKLGVGIPISVRFEYAAIVDDPLVNGDHLFSLSLQYTQEVF